MTLVLITAIYLSELEIKSTSILNYMSQWFAVNGLFQNIEKTNALHFKSPKWIISNLLSHVKKLKKLFGLVF